MKQLKSITSGTRQPRSLRFSKKKSDEEGEKAKRALEAKLNELEKRLALAHRALADKQKQIASSNAKLMEEAKKREMEARRRAELEKRKESEKKAQEAKKRRKRRRNTLRRKTRMIDDLQGFQLRANLYLA